jgi:hypothetical protein
MYTYTKDCAAARRRKGKKKKIPSLCKCLVYTTFAAVLMYYSRAEH